MGKNSPLIPLCRLFENTSAKGNRYLIGNLPYTTKLIAFQEETDDGQTVWQLYVQERPARLATLLGLTATRRDRYPMGH